MKPFNAVVLLAATTLAQPQNVEQQPLAASSLPTSKGDRTPSPLKIDAIPLLGFGTWNLKENCTEAVSYAIQIGYRHIDCAKAYGNEKEVGQGIAEGLMKTGLKREDLWITSKLWNDAHDPNKVEPAIDNTLENLGVCYLDLYHMHWPVKDGWFGRKYIDYIDTWAAMGLLLEKNKTRHIGVSNFSPDQMKNLLNHTSHVPSKLTPPRLHPYLQQSSWISWHAKHNIHVTAYSPFAGTNPTYNPGNISSVLNNTVITKIASKRSCTPAQVVLAWGMSRGTSVIPKTAHLDRAKENLGAAECVLKKKDLEKIAELHSVRARFNNPSESWGVELYGGLEDRRGEHKKHS